MPQVNWRSARNVRRRQLGATLPSVTASGA